MQPPPMTSARIFVGEIPIAPLIIEVTDAERGALRLCRGGYTTSDDSELGQMFAGLFERGLVKDVQLGAGWTAWKLTRDGLALLNPPA